MNEKNIVVDVIKIILLLLFPPLGVYFYVGFGVHFWINLLLTILGYFPGLIHGIYIVGHPDMHEYD